MDTFKSFRSLLSEENKLSFNDKALTLFQFQAQHNPIYKEYIKQLSIDPKKTRKVEEIPFLPISFFKTQIIKTDEWTPETQFTSSGTTGSTPSIHYISDVNFYLHHARNCFERRFGDLRNYHLLALLPSYLERKGSSLVEMIRHFIDCTESPYSSFYLHNEAQLVVDLEKLQDGNKPVILWGVSFALLDLAERYEMDLSRCLLFETGGMKGRRREITRQELHSLLKRAFNLEKIYSEYGMTELLSQAYSNGEDKFLCPPSMRILIREVTDPMRKGIIGETGVINVVDLANFHSIAFVETEDLGKMHENGSFEVLGRVDNSEVRGCNLLIE